MLGLKEGLFQEMPASTGLGILPPDWRVTFKQKMEDEKDTGFVGFAGIAMSKPKSLLIGGLYDWWHRVPQRLQNEEDFKIMLAVDSGPYIIRFRMNRV